MIYHGFFEVLVLHGLDLLLEESAESLLDPTVTGFSLLLSHWGISQAQDPTDRIYCYQS